MKTHGASAIFHVANLDAALKHYVDVLGFSEEFHFGRYAGIRLGEVVLHLAEGPGVYHLPIGGSAIYLYCDEIDAYHQKVAASGAQVKATPENRSYGMRDFTVMDLDGNLVHFGCEVQPSQPE